MYIPYIKSLILNLLIFFNVSVEFANTNFVTFKSFIWLQCLIKVGYLKSIFGWNNDFEMRLL